MAKTKQSSRPIPPGELAGSSEVLEALGLANRSHLKYHRDHDPTFPQPVRVLACGPVWDLRQVRAWQAARNR